MVAERLTRDSWLEAALHALDEGGLEAVKVLPLAKALGVSRGSFYWHFRDREELLDKLVEHWKQRYTVEVIDRAKQARGDARARLLALMKDVLHRREGRFEPAMRAWARHDPKVAAAVRAADKYRLAYTTSLFREMGFSEREAEARGRLTLLYFLGDHMMFAPESATRRNQLLSLRHRILTQ